MAKTLRCKDAGVENCNYEVTGNTDEEVLTKAGEHGRQAHGMKEITGEMRSKLKSLIKDEPGR